MFATQIVPLDNTISIIPINNGVPVNQSTTNSSGSMTPVSSGIIIPINQCSTISSNSITFSKSDCGIQLQETTKTKNNLITSCQINRTTLTTLNSPTNIPKSLSSNKTSKSEDYVLYREYSAEFKEQIVELHNRNIIPRAELLRKFNIPLGTFGYWLRKSKLKNQDYDIAKNKDQVVESCCQSNISARRKERSSSSSDQEELSEISTKLQNQNCVSTLKIRLNHTAEENEQAVRPITFHRLNNISQNEIAQKSIYSSSDSSKEKIYEPAIKSISLAIPILDAIDSIQKMIDNEFFARNRSSKIGTRKKF